MSFCVEMKRIRESAGMTQAELAKLSGTDEETINHIEHGGDHPSFYRDDSLRFVIASVLINAKTVR